MSIKPRGLRNCNPLNIRHSFSHWQGMRARQTDEKFVQFCSMSYGYRAAFCLLRTYRTHYGCDTPRLIIERWAPTGENDTQMYLRKVCALTGFSPDHQFLSDHDPKLVPLVQAMSRIENGIPANPLEVRAGWNLYLG